jgi:imidazolonepropionase-like amidohydrolase
MATARTRSVAFLLLAIAVGSLLVPLLTTSAAAPTPSKTLALVGGRILTQTSAGPITGTILVRDGKIIAVRSAVRLPADAERIDVTGCVITPGLIDARSTLWLAAETIRDSASDGGLDILDGVDPHSEDWKEVVRQGVTAVYVQPGNAGLLGGRGAVVRVAPAETVDGLVIKASAGVQAALGTASDAPAPAAPTMAFGRRGGFDPTPAAPAQPAAAAAGNSLTRYGQYEQLRRTLQGTGQAQGTTGRGRRDAGRDFLSTVRKGEMPLRLEVHREDEVRNALRLADGLKLRLILEGVSNAGLAAEAIANHRVPLVLGPFVELEEAPSYRKGRPADWPKGLLAPESRWALGTFSTQPRGSRLLRVHAAAAVARGLDADCVLRAMTRDAAEILGVDDRLGTIAEGKQADLAVFAGDPLDPSVPVRLIVGQGKILYQNDVRPVPVVSSGHPTAPLELPARLPKEYALRSRRLVSEDGKLQPGTVLVRDGKVAAVGSAVNVGDDIPIYDVGSAVLAPGLVAGHSHLGLASAIDDPAEADAGQVRAADVYDPRQRAVRELLDGGFTSVLFAPGSVNVVAGTAAGVRPGAAEPLRGDVGVKFVLAAGARTSGRVVQESADDVISAVLGRARGPSRYPGSLAGQVELIEQVLSGKGSATELYVPARVRDQIQADRRRAVAAVLERKLVALFEVHTRAEVDAALRLIGRFKLRAVLVGPEEVRPAFDEITRLGVGIVARPLREGDYDRAAQELADAAAAGVPVAFSGTAMEMRVMAALAMNAGMPREAAWRGLTTAAAQMTGLPEGAGRLMVGAPADVVVWDGEPLDLRSRPLRVIVEAP